MLSFSRDVCNQEEVGDRRGWCLWEDLFAHCFQQGSISRSLRAHCVRELCRRHRGGWKTGERYQIIIITTTTTISCVSV